MTYEYYASFADLTKRALEDYLTSHWGTPLNFPTLTSLQARAVNPSANLEYVNAQTNESAARDEWERIVSRLVELLRWMDETNEVYEEWLNEVYEKDNAERRKVHNSIAASMDNAKHEFFTIMCEIYYNLWD